MIEVESIESEMGEIVAASRDGRACALGFVEQWPRLSLAFAREPTTHAATDLGRRIARYLRGDLRALDAVVTGARGTPFQKRVWLELRAIPAGETISYAELARRIGAPTSIRAVAHANALNPVSLVVPCHRVVGSDGALRGYAGGLDRKRWLIAHERAHAVSSSVANTSPTFLPSQTTA